MKNIIKISVFCLLSFFFLDARAQSKKTVSEEVAVTGVCKMCKERIETAVLGVKGVKMATWNAQAQKLKVYYKTKHTSLEQIQQTVAAAGHDTRDVKAKDEAYKKLPDCCLYRDGVKVH